MASPLINRESMAGSPVLLNVYESSIANPFVRRLGLGIYHTSVQVLGHDYMFLPRPTRSDGDGPDQGGGIVMDPSCQGLKLLRSIYIGNTQFAAGRVAEERGKLESEYPGNSFNLFTRNCNHFSDRLCRALTGNGIPWWLKYRFATLFGSLFSCIVPMESEVMKMAAISGPAANDDNNDNADGARSNDETSSASATEVGADNGYEGDVNDNNVSSNNSDADADDHNNNETSSTTAVVGSKNGSSAEGYEGDADLNNVISTDGGANTEDSLETSWSDPDAGVWDGICEEMHKRARDRREAGGASPPAVTVEPFVGGESSTESSDIFKPGGDADHQAWASGTESSLDIFFGDDAVEDFVDPERNKKSSVKFLRGYGSS